VLHQGGVIPTGAEPLRVRDACGEAAWKSAAARPPRRVEQPGAIVTTTPREPLTRAGSVSAATPPFDAA